MSALANISIDLDKIPQDAIYQGKKGRYVSITVSVNDELDSYGNQVAASISQSKEQREAKDKKTYVGNGNVVWVGDTGVTAIPRPKEGGDDLPF